MNIRLLDAGKRFNREWIFRHANVQFSSPQAYAITGPNGSGKSTFVQIVGGLLHPSEGSLEYAMGHTPLASEEVYNYISFCAPYMDVIEEMTLVEFFQFHFSFKTYLLGMDGKKVTEAIGLQAAANKQIRFYSSGMKQRVKLAQAIFSNTPLVLLDEPCSNLDQQGIQLYHSLIQNYCRDRLVIVSSNDAVEYRFCDEVIPITSFKNNSVSMSDR